MHGRFLTDPVNYDTEAASKKKPPSRGPRTVFDEGEYELLFFFFDTVPTPALLFGKKGRFFFPLLTALRSNGVPFILLCMGKKKEKLQFLMDTIFFSFILLSPSFFS